MCRVVSTYELLFLRLQNSSLQLNILFFERSFGCWIYIGIFQECIFNRADSVLFCIPKRQPLLLCKECHNCTWFKKILVASSYQRFSSGLQEQYLQASKVDALPSFNVQWKSLNVITVIVISHLK
jgi:hypothetical protein